MSVSLGQLASLCWKESEVNQCTDDSNLFVTENLQYTPLMTYPELECRSQL